MLILVVVAATGGTAAAAGETAAAEGETGAAAGESAFDKALQVYRQKRSIAPNTAFFAASDELKGLKAEERAVVCERLARHVEREYGDLQAAGLFAAGAVMDWIYPIEEARSQEPSRAAALCERRFAVASWGIEMTLPWNLGDRSRDFNASRAARLRADQLDLWLSREKLARPHWKAHTWWLRGASRLALKEYDEAGEAFAAFAAASRELKSDRFVTVADGWRALARRGAGQPDAAEALARAIAQLERSDDKVAREQAAELRRAAAWLDRGE